MKSTTTAKKVKTIFLIIVIILAVLVCISLITYNIDKQRALNGETPKYIIHKDYIDDGGTIVYYGLWYQIIKWKQMTNERDYYYVGIECHYIFYTSPPKSPSIKELELVKLDN